MRKRGWYFGILMLLVITMTGCASSSEVYLQTPKGEMIKVDRKQAKELTEALENLQLVEYDGELYGSLPYRFTIKNQDGDKYLQLLDYGIIMYDDKYYIQSKFEKIFDISRNIYKGINDVLYEDEYFQMFDFQPYRYVHYFDNGKVYYEDEIFVDGNCTIREISSWYGDEINQDESIEKYFQLNNKTALNDVIELKGKYNYIFKKISEFENVYLLKCDGPVIEDKILQH